MTPAAAATRHTCRLGSLRRMARQFFPVRAHPRSQKRPPLGRPFKMREATAVQAVDACGLGSRRPPIGGVSPRPAKPIAIIIQVDGLGDYRGWGPIGGGCKIEIVDSAVGGDGSENVTSYSSVIEYGVVCVHERRDRRVGADRGESRGRELASQSHRACCLRRNTCVSVTVAPAGSGVLRQRAHDRQLLRSGSEIDIRFGHPDCDRASRIAKHRDGCVGAAKVRAGG